MAALLLNHAQHVADGKTEKDLHNYTEICRSHSSNKNKKHASQETLRSGRTARTVDWSTYIAASWHGYKQCAYLIEQATGMPEFKVQRDTCTVRKHYVGSSCHMEARRKLYYS